MKWTLEQIAEADSKCNVTQFKRLWKKHFPNMDHLLAYAYECSYRNCGNSLIQIVLISDIDGLKRDGVLDGINKMIEDLLAL